MALASKLSLNQKYFYFSFTLCRPRINSFADCRPKNVFHGTIERMVLYQPNFWFFSGLSTTLNQFRARAGFRINLVSPFRTLLYDKEHKRSRIDIIVHSKTISI